MLLKQLCWVPLVIGFAACGGKKASSTIDAGAPVYDSELSIPEMDGEVSVYFDAQGVLNAECSTDADCVAVEGYFHAAHRFFQMDLRRRIARGRLSELAGGIVLDADHRSRTVLATIDGGRIEDALWAAASPETKVMMEAYTKGVNAWLADLRAERNGAKLSSEYDFSIIDKTRLDDWEVLDSVACFLPLLDQLTNSSGSDLFAGEAIAALGENVALDLFGLMPLTDSSILPATQNQAGPSKALPKRPDLKSFLSVIRDAQKIVGSERKADHIGSNNWVVGPAIANGSALLANDPHLGLGNPSVWYMVHLDAKTKGSGQLHIAGASFAGLPGIIFGQNENIAVGVTNSYFDQSDVYLETLNADRTAVIFNGTEVPIINIDYSYEVAGSTTPTVRTAQYVPHHGPILSIDTVAGTATSLRWTAQDADTDINFVWELWTAASTDEAKTALTNVTSIGQNFVVIDTAGTFGWYPYNHVPARPWMATTPGWLPLPGDGTAEWGDYIPYADLPQATSPASGYIATANNDMTGAVYDGDLSNDNQAAAQTFLAAGFRHERISELLEASTDHDLPNMQSIQHDTKSLYGERITPLLLADLADATLSADAQSLVAALSAWDFFCPTGYDNNDFSAPVPSTDSAVIASAIGCTAFHVVWPRLKAMTFDDEVSELGSTLTAGDQALGRAFLRPDDLSQNYWDDETTNGPAETRADIVLAAVEDAASFLVKDFGADSDAWRWGALHTVYMPADLFSSAGITSYDHGPFMHDGAKSTIDVAHPDNDRKDDYGHTAGATIRLTCEAKSTGVGCAYELPGGQRHDRQDPLYNSLLEDWLNHTPSPLPFSIDEMKASAIESVLVK